ncbi:hypothetical protein K3495_g7404 [Podosphaera aphanis]|nr:hypothetical protein K3495_g7404 [Podosphaera aphanis]
MVTADGNSTPLPEFVKCTVGIGGVWRTIYAFKRPEIPGKTDPSHLLLGLPWLFSVDARINIRQFTLEIGDTTKARERRVYVQTPVWEPQEQQKLILRPRDFETIKRLPPPPVIEVSSSSSLGGDSSDPESSDEDTSVQQLQGKDIVKCGTIELPQKVPKSFEQPQKLLPCLYSFTEIFGPTEKLHTKLSSLGSEDSASIEASPINAATQKATGEVRTPPFPTRRRPQVRQLSQQSFDVIEEWFGTSGIKIGPKVPDYSARGHLKRLLYTYRSIHAEKLEHMPPTDLYTHKIRLKSGTRPFARKQKRWPPDKLWWLREIVGEGLKCNMYEYTTVANGEFSQWDAPAVLLDKSENPEWGDQPRITFNYSNVHEELPGCQMPLMAEVHEFLSNPKWEMFCQFDFKHSYWSTGLHPESRPYLAFTLSDLSQLQPTRLPQGS